MPTKPLRQREASVSFLLNTSFFEQPSSERYPYDADDDELLQVDGRKACAGDIREVCIDACLHPRHIGSCPCVLRRCAVIMFILTLCVRLCRPQEMRKRRLRFVPGMIKVGCKGYKTAGPRPRFFSFWFRPPSPARQHACTHFTLPSLPSTQKCFSPTKRAPESCGAPVAAATLGSTLVRQQVRVSVLKCSVTSKRVHQLLTQSHRKSSSARCCGSTPTDSHPAAQLCQLCC
jgi:hypothetical protein